MSSLFKEYAVDTQSTEGGRWVRDTFRGGIAIKMRAMQSKAVRAINEKVQQRNMKYVRRNATIPQEVIDKNAMELACAIVVDWEGVTDEQDSALPCTDENKRRIFSDSRLAEFRDSVIGVASSADTFRADNEVDAENLSSASAPSPVPAEVPAAPQS